MSVTPSPRELRAQLSELTIRDEHRLRRRLDRARDETTRIAVATEIADAVAAQLGTLAHYSNFGDLVPETTLVLAERLAALASPYGGGKRLGAPYGTDAAVISAAGVPAVVFGPGDIAQAHSSDEWIELAQLPSAVEVLLQAISAD